MIDADVFGAAESITASVAVAAAAGSAANKLSTAPAIIGNFSFTKSLIASIALLAWSALMPAFSVRRVINSFMIIVLKFDIQIWYFFKG